MEVAKLKEVNEELQKKQVKCSQNLGFYKMIFGKLMPLTLLYCSLIATGGYGSPEKSGTSPF